MNFKAYSISESRWLSEKDHVYLSPDGDLYQWRKSIFSLGKMHRMPFTLYKYHVEIGMLDKKYRPIHEGDICKLENDDGEVIGMIAYAEEVCGYVLLDDVNLRFYPLTNLMTPYIEIIGNVLDNPSLLPQHVKEASSNE